MATMMTFNELRQLKDSLPSGSMQRIADELGMDVNTVRNYFGGSCGPGGEPAGIHFEQGPQGGIVKIDDTTILDKAKEILADS
ncbi:MAG: DNA-binding protein [Culturomica sp.]|nr:DNA-binding protein [Culturomica sp.]